MVSDLIISSSEIDHEFQRGKGKRSTGRTDMNLVSSRSHAIFTVVIESVSDGLLSGEKGGHVKVGKLNLVDLAGSEKQTKVNTTFICH